MEAIKQLVQKKWLGTIASIDIMLMLMIMIIGFAYQGLGDIENILAVLALVLMAWTLLWGLLLCLGKGNFSAARQLSDFFESHTGLTLLTVLLLGMSMSFFMVFAWLTPKAVVSSQQGYVVTGFAWRNPFATRIFPLQESLCQRGQIDVVLQGERIISFNVKMNFVLNSQQAQTRLEDEPLAWRGKYHQITDNRPQTRIVFNYNPNKSLREQIFDRIITSQANDFKALGYLPDKGSLIIQLID